MVDGRNFLVQVKNHWTNIRQSLQPYLSYDYERCLDLILIGAGIRPLPGAEPWKRKCLILYRLLGFYQFLMSIAKVVLSIRNGNDLLGICASFAISVTLTAISIKVYIFGNYDEVVRQSKIFVNKNFSCSGDPDYDATVRRENAAAPGKATLVIFIILCFDQVTLLIPNSVWDSIYDIPEEFHVLGAPRVMRAMYVFLLYTFWGSGYFSCPLTLVPLLNGLRHELLIVAHGYETIAERAKDQILNDQNNPTGTSRKYFDNVLMMRHSKRKLTFIIEQHIEVLRVIHLLQPLVSYLYAVTYYCVTIVTSLLVFVVIRSDITLAIVMVLGSTGILFVVECYMWCRMIDSLQETMKMIADCVVPLGFGLEHSIDNHSEYIEMRTSIMIIQLNASRCDWFSCAGIFPISIESFGGLCMIIYKFATFLLGFE